MPDMKDVFKSKVPGTELDSDELREQQPEAFAAIKKLCDDWNEQEGIEDIHMDGGLDPAGWTYFVVGPEAGDLAGIIVTEQRESGPREPANVWFPDAKVWKNVEDLEGDELAKTRQLNRMFPGGIGGM